VPDEPRRPSRARAVRAFLIAPLAAPALYWLLATAEAIADPVRRPSAFQAPFVALAVVVAFGAPVSYAATLAAGFPAWWMLRRPAGPAVVGLIVLGALTGAATAWLMAPWLSGELVSIPLPPWEGAALGAASAALFFRMARSRPPSRSTGESH
jgi:hypothetical protein